MSLDQFVNFQILVNNSGVQRAGFGLIGMLTYKTHFAGRSKLYGRTADMITDGFAATDIEVRAVTRILQQNPHYPNVLLLRGSNPPTQVYVVDATAVDKAEYDMTVVGEGFADTDISYVAGVGTTVALINDNLLTQLNAVSGKNYLAAFAPLVVSPLVVTADATSNLLDHAAHGLHHGAGPFQFTNSGGALPGGIAAATNYWVIHTTGMDADHFEIATTLANALAGTFVDITDAGTGTQTMSDTGATVDPSVPFTVTASAAGNWFGLDSHDVDLIANTQTYADPGIAADLDAISKKDSTWYYLDTLWNSKACVLGAASWVEANGKAYAPTVNDSGACTVAIGDTPTDAPAALFALEYKNTMYMYHDAPQSFLSEGLIGLLSPKNVGLWTAKGKTPTGVVPVPLTPEHQANLLARKCGSITFEAGRNVTWEGEVANPDYGFFDIKVSLDFVSDAVIKAGFGALVSLDKVAYTDEDIAVIQGAIEGVILDCVSSAHKIMAPGTPDDPTDPAPSIVFPKVADIDPSVRALRELPDGQLTFRMQGAVHKIFVTATVSF